MVGTVESGPSSSSVDAISASASLNQPEHQGVSGAFAPLTLWRSLKYECVYLHAWETGSQAKAAIGSWITFYNHRRPHTAHGGQPPAVVYFNSIETDQQAQAVA